MKKGFTLIELIIVVIILGILAAVGIPQYMKAIEKARGAEGYAGLGYIQQGEKIYYANNEVYLASAALSAADQQKLDIALPLKGWSFAITITAAPPTFTAIATRAAGQCIAKTMQVDQTGKLDDLIWRTCQESL